MREGQHVTVDVLNDTDVPMKASTQKILTTHVGSLSRPERLIEANRRRAADEVDDQELCEGDVVVVEQLNGLTLAVRCADEWERSA